MHVIEPMLLLASERGSVDRIQVWREGDVTSVAVAYGSGFQAHISTLGSSQAPLAMRVIGETGWRDLIFKDTFPAFKAALFEFVQGIIYRNERIHPDFMLEVVMLIEAGRGH